MKKLILLTFVLLPFFTEAQQPKLNLKLTGGINTNSFIYQVEGESSEIFTGWQFGAGARVMKRRAFVEFDGLFQNYGTSVFLSGDSISDAGDRLTFRMRALEFPVTAGYIPVKTAFFKLFVYGGFVNKFSLNGKANYLDQDYKIKPKELNLHFYNLLARFGSQFDLAMFNFDFNYNIGITNGVKNKARTNTNGFQISISLLY